MSSRRVGRVLGGKWKIEHLLGEGGAGAVYQARGPDGAVAVKMLHRELADEPIVRARFLREAYVANTIGHPGAVRVIEDGVDQEGVPYLVMELLEGEDYESRRVRKGGRLDVGEVLWIGDHVLAVLAAAHAKGIVHRDIKPENLFLTRDRQLKVLDFGIARLSDHETTQAGSILGTLAYMPPEQARGDVTEVGVRSDLWSVGATMFTLLSGRLVRYDEDLVKLLREAGSTKVPSLGEVVSGLPPELVELVDAALLHDANVRWPTAKLMRRALLILHTKLKHQSRQRSGDDGEDGGVSEPSFGVIFTNTIEPPPVSIYSDDHRMVITPLGALPADLVHQGPTLHVTGEARDASKAPASTSTLNSARSPVTTGLAHPSSSPTPQDVPSSSPPSRQAETVRRPKPPEPPSRLTAATSSARLAWLAFGVAMVVVLVLLFLLTRR